MPMAHATAQFAFDFSPPAAPSRDLLARRLVAGGFAPNDYVLSINRALATPDRSDLPKPWSLPSRLFHWPVDYLPADGDARDLLRLRHPALADHPGLTRLREAIPEPDAWAAPDTTGHGTWHHAVDLMTPELWPALLATLSFTTAADAATALAYAMHERTRAHSDLTRERRGRTAPWTPALARTILARLGFDEPADASRALIAGTGLRPSRVNGRIAPNLFCEGGEAAWLVVHGLEQDFLAYGRDNALTVTESGMALRQSIDHGQVPAPN